ncbi:hypothetical protein P200_gp036 [Pelagibacter phage HTVC200P]|nr:hypothetical protein P200_gp036 [Pelagibacter phage HTVC200P]
MAYTTINKHTDYFNTKLYTGNGSTQNITGVGFQPDFIWQKERNGTSYFVITDSVRGNTKQLFPNVAAAEATDSNYITSFDSDGFGQGQNNDTNENSKNYVAWNWKAGTTGSGTTGGSGTNKSYSYSVNTTAGFSIIKYEGNGTAGHTIPHHLGVAPKLVIAKNRDASSNSWAVYSETNGNGLFFLDATDAGAVYSSIYNNTAPTSSVVTLGNGGNANANTQNIVLYCFAEKTGYSKFGKYIGNGSTNGTFAYTGFKPSVVFIKDISAVRNWVQYDNKRDTYNYVRNALTSNDASAVEFDNSNYNRIDFLSNGFKMRGGSSGVGNDTNASGGTYVYMAFGQSLPKFD